MILAGMKKPQRIRLGLIVLLGQDSRGQRVVMFHVKQLGENRERGLWVCLTKNNPIPPHFIIVDIVGR